MILIDSPIWPGHGRRWSHLVSDESYAELHTFAAELGLSRRAFDGDHYDLPESMYQQAIDAGATAVTGRELVTRLNAAGLRRRKTRRTDDT
ncbi:DUF4031 domain-containing protein [Phytoactinopolyspora limicola]|uniref:DUF4031 domain-containing protein n=1 Tax=Phytoactinopolyspora limicola TaxID=2715536 RepID=UPI00140AE071|nr:DUF4031 domain-containing protein [Phytoactinopolyspora limicola]